MVELPFQDRSEAGRLLGAELAKCRLPANVIVLALPRGGVPVGAEVAARLKAPLDVIVVRKLGVPWQPELALGAIASGTRVLDEQLIHQLRVSDKEIEALTVQEARELERREKLYRRDLPPPNLRGCVVVLVDDGLATGSTMVAAARHVRSMGVQRLIIAVPVASTQGCSRMRGESDNSICLALPDPFSAVEEWYKDFRQVTDDEVGRILKGSHSPVESMG